MATAATGGPTGAALAWARHILAAEAQAAGPDLGRMAQHFEALGDPAIPARVWLWGGVVTAIVALAMILAGGAIRHALLTAAVDYAALTCGAC